MMNATRIKPLTPARTTRGVFARHSDPAAIREVELPNGLCGWRVGSGGYIYSSRAAALRHATNRAKLIVRFNERLARQYEESIEKSWN